MLHCNNQNIMFIFCLLFFAQALPHFYHTSDEIDLEIDRLLEKCHHATKKVHHKSGIVSVHLNHHLQKKAVLLFGEHPRELITAETGLHLLKHMCQRHNPDYNIKMIINMNPHSRRYVEKGHYCLRENQRGVDLNRNYDFRWEQKTDHKAGDSSGEYPFSEHETQVVRNLLEEFQPDVFISVHSGALAMLTPWAYKMAEESTDESLHQLKAKHCSHCIVGGAARSIGYTAKGCSMDYAFGVANVQRSYTFEIYSFSQGLSVKEPESNFAEFLQSKDKAEIKLKELDCFQFFNPSTQNRYEQTVQRWTNIILDVLKSE